MRPASRHPSAVLLLLIAIAVAATLLPWLVTEGMFFDGLTYATLGRNLAEGQGSFWNPYFSSTWIGFHEHPPLGIAVLAGAYRVLGSSVWVEKVYGLALMLIEAVLIAALWARFRREDRLWPVLLWVTIPIVSWAHASNLLELPQTVFVLAAVLALVAALQRRPDARFVLLASLSGCCVACALLAKGPVGLLPIGVPLLHWVAFRSPSPRAVVTATLLCLACAAAVIGLMLLDPEAVRALGVYLHGQLGKAFSGDRGATSRLVILWTLVAELAPAAGVVLLLKLGARRWASGTPVEPAPLRAAWFFLLIGLAGSLPILLSAKQARYYVVPSLPFFALAAGLASAGEARLVLSRAGRRAIVAAAVVLAVVATIGLHRAGDIGRDKPLVLFAREASARLPRGATVNLCPALSTHHPLASYLARYGHIGVWDQAADAPFLLSDGSCPDKQRLYPVTVFRQGELTVLRR